MAIGSISETAVHIREAETASIRHIKRSANLLRNHPSSEAKPSYADLAVTRNTQKALFVMRMTFHHHLTNTYTT